VLQRLKHQHNQAALLRAQTRHGGRWRGSRRTAATAQGNGGGTVWNERGNNANAKERGEHEHQWLT